MKNEPLISSKRSANVDFPWSNPSTDTHSLPIWAIIEKLRILSTGKWARSGTEVIQRRKTSILCFRKMPFVLDRLTERLEKASHCLSELYAQDQSFDDLFDPLLHRLSSAATLTTRDSLSMLETNLMDIDQLIQRDETLPQHVQVSLTQFYFKILLLCEAKALDSIFSVARHCYFAQNYWSIIKNSKHKKLMYALQMAPFHLVDWIRSLSKMLNRKALSFSAVDRHLIVPIFTTGAIGLFQQSRYALEYMGSHIHSEIHQRWKVLHQRRHLLALSVSQILRIDHISDHSVSLSQLNRDIDSSLIQLVHVLPSHQKTLIVPSETVTGPLLRQNLLLLIRNVNGLIHENDTFKQDQGIPSIWSLYWPHLTVTGISLYLFYSRGNISVLKNMVFSIIDASRNFVVEYLYKPLIRIWETVSHKEATLALLKADSLQTDLEVLQRNH
jgi:nuclear-control-of-ATPase protein 2